MGSRRRNLVILAIVLALTAASAWVIATQRTVLGLDLRGGTELVYKASPTAKNPTIDAQDIDRAIDILRERTDELGVSEPEIARIGTDQIEVGLPDVSNAERAIEQVGTTAQLFLYDYERNLLERDPELSPEQQTFGRIYDAVQFASEQKPECFQDLCTTNGPTYYLFDSGSLELLAGPAERKEDLYLDSPDGEQPEGTEVLTVPQGTVVLLAPGPTDDPATEVNEAENAPAEYVVLKDRPELSGDEIEDPKQQTDQGGAPNVTFEFTDEGRAAFQEVTRRIAQRGAAKPGAGGACATPEGGDQFSDSFAVVLDSEIVSRPIINFCENPDGIDGRTGAQISGLDSLTEAQDLAKFLQIGALPVELSLISQSTVSATLGEEALDQGLKAGLAGLALVLLFLLAYYRVLGLVAGLGLLVYARLLPGDDQADPDHADPAGDRGTGADDRRRGRRERRHLRANKGGGEGGQVARLGDRHRLPQGDRDDHRRERDHADHGVHPLRARVGRSQGLRVHARHRDDRLAVHRGPVHAGDPRRLRPCQVHALAGGPGRLGRGRRLEASTSSARAAGSSRSRG